MAPHYATNVCSNGTNGDREITSTLSLSGQVFQCAVYEEEGSLTYNLVHLRSIKCRFGFRTWFLERRPRSRPRLSRLCHWKSTITSRQVTKNKGDALTYLLLLTYLLTEKTMYTETEIHASWTPSLHKSHKVNFDLLFIALSVYISVFLYDYISIICIRDRVKDADTTL